MIEHEWWGTTDGLAFWGWMLGVIVSVAVICWGVAELKRYRAYRQWSRWEREMEDDDR